MANHNLNIDEVKKDTNNNNRQKKPAKDTLESVPVKETSRRGFLKKIWGWLVLITGAELAGLSIPFLGSGKKKQKKEETGKFTEITSASDIPEGSVFAYRPGRLYICHLKDGGFLAVSIKCTHLGCSVEWNKEKKEFICPCHHSMFSLTGDVENPPATRALSIYPLKIENGTVKVNLAKPTQRKHFNKSQEIYS